MAEFLRPLSEEYWRPPAGEAHQRYGFPSQGNDAFCAICGAPYVAGAVFCHLCGSGRDGDSQDRKPNPVNSWFDLASLRTQFELSRVSLACALGAVIFLLAALLTGMVYNTSTLAEWQAVQCLRIEWLLAAVVALVAAMLFRTKP